MSHNVRIIRVTCPREAERELRGIGSDERGVAIMTDKAVHCVVKLEGLDVRSANILKQEALSIGGEAAISRGVWDLKTRETDVLLMGTLKHHRLLVEKLKVQPFGLRDLAAELHEAMERYCPHPRTMTWKGNTLEIGKRTLIMGVINVTPDSFSDGGEHLDSDEAARRGNHMVIQGADVLDVGGESTRPGSQPVSTQKELERIVPVIEALARKVAVPISVDTYKPAVARKALEMGASMVNDVTGLRDPEMIKLVAEHDVPVIIMHMKGEPASMQKNPTYEDVMGEIISYLRKAVNRAVEGGVDREKIFVDPGIGFGKKLVHNLEILRRLGELRVLGVPVLVGPSRKSFLGQVLDLPVGERLEGTLAATALCAWNGADMLRVHDVKEAVRAAKVADAIKASL